MVQRGPAWTTSLVVLVSVSASCGAPIGLVHAAAECAAKPNAPAPQGQHWYHRTDRGARHRCWYLAPQDMSAQKSATNTSQKATAEGPKTPAVASGAPQVPATKPPTGAAPAPAVANGFAPAIPSPWPEAARFSDAPPSFASATPASDCGGAQQLLAKVRPSPAAEGAMGVNGDHAFALIMLGTVLLAVTGPVLHAMRRPRNVSDRDDLRAPSSSTLSASGSRATARDLYSDIAVRRVKPLKQTEDGAQMLQRVLDEMQARRHDRDPTNRVGHMA